MVSEMSSNIQVIAEQIKIIAENMKNLERSNEYYIALIGFFGTIFGAVVSWLLLKWQIKRQEKKQAEYSNEERVRLASSLLVEISILKEFIKSRMDYLLATPAENYLYIFIVEKYFNIYDSNTEKIGKFDDKCAESLVNAYMQTKSLFDSTRTLTIITQEIENINMKSVFYNNEAKNERVEMLLGDKKNEYKNYSERLLLQGQDVLKLIESTIFFLEEEKKKII